MSYHSLCSNSSSSNCNTDDLKHAASLAILLGRAYQTGKLRNSSEGYILFNDPSKRHNPVSFTENLLEVIGADEAMVGKSIVLLSAAYCVVCPAGQACYVGTWRDDNASFEAAKAVEDKAGRLIAIGRDYLEFGGLDGSAKKLKKYLLITDPTLAPIENVMSNMMA